VIPSPLLLTKSLMLLTVLLLDSSEKGMRKEEEERAYGRGEWEEFSLILRADKMATEEEEEENCYFCCSLYNLLMTADDLVCCSPAADYCPLITHTHTMYNEWSISISDEADGFPPPHSLLHIISSSISQHQQNRSEPVQQSQARDITRRPQALAPKYIADQRAHAAPNSSSSFFIRSSSNQRRTIISAAAAAILPHKQTHPPPPP
jgi:hypothetical protein